MVPRNGSKRRQRQPSGARREPAPSSLQTAGPRLPGVAKKQGSLPGAGSNRPRGQKSRLGSGGSGGMQPATSAQLDAAEAGPAGN